MAQSPDRRLPCGQTNQHVIAWLGSCNNAVQCPDTKIKRNVTLMKDYQSGSAYTASGVTPYSFAIQDCVSTPYTLGAYCSPCCSPYAEFDCDDFPQYDCGQTGGTGNGEIPCGVPLASDIMPCGGGSSSFSTGLGMYHNCYVQTEETASGAIRQLGFKNVYASKIWQGIYSYTSVMHHKADFWDWCGDGCAYYNYIAEPDQTRYRTITVSATWDVDSPVRTYTDVGDPYEYCCYGEGYPCGACSSGDEGCSCYTGQCRNLDITYKHWGGSANSTCTVDLYGNVTGTCYSSSYGANDYGGCDVAPDPPACLATSEAFLASVVAGLLGEANNDWTNLISIFGCNVNNGTGCGSFGIPSSVTGDGSSWHLVFTSHYDVWCFDGCGCPLDSGGDYTSAEVTITPTSLNIKQWSVTVAPQYEEGTHCPNDGYCHTVFLSRDETWTYSATTYTHTREVWPGYYPSDGYETYTVTATLSDPYTTQQVYDSVVTLLDEWDLGDDEMYPWRMDGGVTLGPYVHYLETGGAPSVPHCSESNVTGYGSTIIGSPGPIGIDKIWNPFHVNYCVCQGNPCGDFSPQFSLYPKSVGAWSTDCGVPRATEWLNYFNALDMPDQAFCGAGFTWIKPSSCNIPTQQVGSTQLWACKRAEAIYNKQSYNFARPCGKDRIEPSASNAWCVRSVADMTITVEDYLMMNPPLPAFEANQRIIVCGVGGIEDGIYEATRDGDYTLTLGECLATGSVLPTPSIADCGSGVVAKVRWNCPGICGKAEIVEATQPNTASLVTCSIDVDAYWYKDDQIWIDSARGMNINGVWTLIPIDARHAALKNSSGSRGTYTGHGLMSYPFGADWKWNDVQSKHDFVINTWKWDFRSWQEWYRVSGSVVWNSGLVQCCNPNPCSTCDCTCPGPAVPSEPYASWKDCYSPYMKEATCETKCLPFDPCISVAYFSPNVESFSTVASHNYGFFFPGIDTDYSTMWQGAVRQSMGDPLFQAPPCPCEYDGDYDVYTCANCSRYEDDGNCNADETEPCVKYYAARDQFEARCDPPEGAPPLPPDTYIGCATTATGCNTNKPVCYPPFGYGDFPYEVSCAPYVVYPFATPWITLLAKEGCVCADGRFAANYIANGINCPDIVPAP